MQKAALLIVSVSPCGLHAYLSGHPKGAVTHCGLNPLSGLLGCHLFKGEGVHVLGEHVWVFEGIRFVGSATAGSPLTWGHFLQLMKPVLWLVTEVQRRVSGCFCKVFLC